MNPTDKLNSLYEQDKPAWKIDKSKIHGQGVMAGRNLKNGSIVDKATDPSSRAQDKITHMGSKLNHSTKPNCLLKRIETSRIIFHNLIAARDVEEGEELTVNYADYPEFADPDPGWD